MINDVYILDSCALIAYIRNENGAQSVAGIFELAVQNECKIYIHSATVAEVYYDTLRFSGKKIAEELFEDFKSLPITFQNTLDNTFIKLLGTYKVDFKVSFADCFVLALASIKKGIIISSDHHEFDEVEKSKNINFHWIR